MSGEMAVSFAIKLNDQGSAAATQALNKLSRALKETEGVAKSTSTAAINAFQKLASSREILGIRSEKAIQNEIRQTEAAYKRLADSGQASARELGRAQDAMRQKVADLRREMDGAKQSAGGMPRALQAAMGAFGAYQAGKMVLQGPVTQTMAYDRQLANLANTAYAGQSIGARRAGMRTLDAAIMSAVRDGGGTREGAMGTLDKLVASGAFSDVGEAARLLPTLTKAGTAANADPTQLADIAIRAKQTFGLTDTSLALDQAMRAGQLGGFELKDMAKWLPQQMAMARMSGLKGDDGYRTLLALNQVSTITAGTKDEAGNNVVNLLAKINSQDTANDFKKLGIDLPGSLQAARAKGVNSVEAFGNLVEQVVAKDKNYGELKKKAESSTGEEQKQAYEAMADIAMGKGLGKTVQDRQALTGILAYLGNKDYFGTVKSGTDERSRGTVGDAHDLISETPSYKAEKLAAEKANALQTALDKVNPLFGQLADHLVANAREYPALTAATTGATVALTALAAVAGAAALPGILMPGGGGGGGGGGGTAGRVLGFAGKALGVVGAFGAGYGAGSWLNGKINDGVSWATDGREDSLGGLVHTMTHGDEMQRYGFQPPASGQAGANAAGAGGETRTVIENKIILDGRQVAESVNEHNARLGARN